MKEQFAIYPNRVTLLGAFLIPIVFTLLATVMLALFWADLTLFPAIVLGVVLLLFGFLSITSGISFAHNFANPQPQLLLGPDGITFCDNNRTPYRLEWAHILCFEKITIARQEYILVGVTNPEALIGTEPGVKYRRLMTHNMNHYGTPFVIAPTLNITTEKLLPTLREFHKKYRLHESA